MIDACGSHGALGALFVAFGKVERAVVIDKFCPASFGNVRDALAPFWGGATDDTGGGEGGGGDGAAASVATTPVAAPTAALATAAFAAPTAPAPSLGLTRGGPPTVYDTGGGAPGASDTGGGCAECEPQEGRLVHVTCDMREALPRMLDAEDDASRVVCIHIYKYKYIYICIYLSIYIYIYVYTYIMNESIPGSVESSANTSAR